MDGGVGRWLLKFGARRLRTARQAQLDPIPAFVNVSADSFDLPWRSKGL